MCAIVGLKIPTSPACPPIENNVDIKALIREMLINAECNGRSATGIMIVNTYVRAQERVFVLKSPYCASKFVETDAYKKFISDNLGVNTITIVGHTRVATSGSALDNRNNHPHKVGRYIGVHHGVIRNDDYIWKDTGFTKKTECDSEAIYAALEYASRQRSMATLEAVAVAATKLKGWFASALINLAFPSQLTLLRDTTSLEVTNIQAGDKCPQTAAYAFSTKRDMFIKAWEKVNTNVGFKAIPSNILEENMAVNITATLNIFKTKISPGKYKSTQQDINDLQITSGMLTERS